MKNTLKILGLLSLFLVAFTFTSCSSDDDPADNDLFVGTYKGNVSYVKAGEETKSNENGSVRVVKVGDTYNFNFSDDIPSIKGIKIEKDKNVAILVGTEESSYIRIDEGVLKILYIKDGATWTANAKR